MLAASRAKHQPTSSRRRANALAQPFRREFPQGRRMAAATAARRNNRLQWFVGKTGGCGARSHTVPLADCSIDELPQPVSASPRCTTGAGASCWPVSRWPSSCSASACTARASISPSSSAPMVGRVGQHLLVSPDVRARRLHRRSAGCASGSISWRLASCCGGPGEAPKDRATYHHRPEALASSASLAPQDAGLAVRPLYPNNTASAAATDPALSVTVRSSAPACTVMFSAKKRASET